MAPQIEISIPGTATSNTTKPYTIYNVTLRLPLRSYSVQKRYSDFLSLNSGLTEQVGSAPPATLPAKSWFSKTVSNPELTEERRKGLEAYLQKINTVDDSRWRSTSVWRAFLNLPSSYSSSSSTAGNLHSVITGPSGSGSGSAPITDPVMWIDCHRDLKTQLHDARLNLTNRDQASSTQKQHEASAAAKSSLVKAGNMLNALEDGLAYFQKQNKQASWSGSGSGSGRIGEGEIRRRKDLLAAAKKDKDGLENLLNAMTHKSKLDSAVANIQDRESLTNAASTASHTQNVSIFGGGGGGRKGRVLGKETSETRELDNKGLVQLQQQKMIDQDLDVDELRKIIQRQRELGTAIHEELEVQNEMLKMVDEDVDRVQSKIDIAKKRIGRIS